MNGTTTEGIRAIKHHCYRNFSEVYRAIREEGFTVESPEGRNTHSLPLRHSDGRTGRLFFRGTGQEFPWRTKLECRIEDGMIYF